MTRLLHYFSGILIMVLILGCKEHKTASMLIAESQKYCLYNNHNQLEDIFSAYKVARNNNNVSKSLDSTIALISRNKDRDTIYILEMCNPPFYNYHAIIWNNDTVLTLNRMGIIGNSTSDSDLILLMEMIEKWNKSVIISKSHEKPLAYCGDWVASRIATRIIVNNHKYEEIESVYFTAIDFNYNGTPILFY